VILIFALALAAAEPNDYSRPETWLCRPGRAGDACSGADLTATVFHANGKLKIEKWKQPKGDPPIDCFYVYPTVSRDTTPNSDMVAGPEEKSVIAHQFARFASQCRVYAPLYRQVTLTALRAGLTGKPMAVDRALAYNDVLAAWNHYLRADNKGRGVVLIGHSQGSGVLIQLIRNEIDGKPVQAQLVSALLLGANLAVPKGRDVGGAFRSIPLCRSSSQTGCAVSYVTFRANEPPPKNTLFGRVQGDGMVAACVNPASLTGGSAPVQAYLGTANWPNLAPKQPLKTPFLTIPGLLSAQCATNEVGSYLALTVHADPRDARPDDIPGDVITNGIKQLNWGLHLIDVNVVIGDLIGLVGKQGKAFRAAK